MYSNLTGSSGRISSFGKPKWPRSEHKPVIAEHLDFHDTGVIEVRQKTFFTNGSYE